MKNLKKFIVVTLIFAMTLSMAACGKKKESTKDNTPVEPISVMGDAKENTLKLSPNGSILEISCEDYSATGVDDAALEDFIKKATDEYNYKYGSDKVDFVEYKNEQGFVRTAIQYKDIEDYNRFNSLDLDVTLYDADTPDQILRDEIASENDATPVVEAEEISEEELAMAGYSLDDLEALEQGGGDASATDAIATFTDASSGSEVKSSDISGDNLMMIVTEEPMNFVINGGTVLYTNSHAETLDSNKARSLGKGKAVIVYAFEF